MAEKYFDSQQPDEDIILVIRRHILALASVLATGALVYLIGIIAVLVLPSVAPILVSGFSYNVYVLFVSLLFLFNTIFLFNSWILHYLHVAILTSEHVVEINQAGLFSRKISEMTLEKVQDVSATQKGLLNTMFDIGQVEVETAGEAPNFVIEYVPSPNKISQKIMETEEIYCKKYGIRTTGVNGNANNNTFTGQANGTVQPEPPSDLPQPNIEYPGDEWKK